MPSLAKSKTSAPHLRVECRHQVRNGRRGSASRLLYTGQDDTITALTDDGIDELKDMLRDARITTETWHAFLDDFVDDADLVARIKAKSPR